MENHPPIEKLRLIMQQLPMGFAEINKEGDIIYQNEEAEALLKPIRIATGITGNNLYLVLDHIAPAISYKIRQSSDEAGAIINAELQCFSLAFGGEIVQRYFSFDVSKTLTDSIIVAFTDITQERGKEQAIQELQSEKTALQGKFEIASNILHDIGNAVVAFGTYVSRIKHTLEELSPGNLQNLANYFSTQRAGMVNWLGEEKADAVISMLSGISDAQEKSRQDIHKSVSEQLNVISHIQAILNIQRQYVTGQEAQEKKPVRLISIIEDCYSMLFASFEKRGIKSTIDIPGDLPVILADRNSLMQVVLNILKNSTEAIDPAAVTKQIDVQAIAGEGIVMLTIQDNGTGFDAATGNQLFKRGFTTKATGSGLGLNHCRGIIEKQGGTMHMTSPGFGKGAQTIITFKV